jgi:hypothetical protein
MQLGFCKWGVTPMGNCKLGGGFSSTLNIEHLLLTLVLVKKLAAVAGDARPDDRSDGE